MNTLTQESSAVEKDSGRENSLISFFRAIKFEHTVFALPFAYLTLFLVEEGLPSLSNFVWITLAMVGARTFALGVNRIIDKEVDARNPRTKAREIASGVLSRSKALTFSLIALAIFVVATLQLEEICRYLMPAVIVPMVVYPYTKRFTWACHLVLGLVYLMVPPAVWLAVSGDLTLAAVVVGIGAAFWVAGFDIVYTTQDEESDRDQGIHSIVADFGLERGLQVARLFHIVTVAALVAAGILLDTGAFYYLGLAAMALLLIYEHRIVTPKDLTRVNAAFFTTNGIISVAFFGFVAADVLV
jgi:4-hydroxybenzoate polyprenyltransferase